MSVSVSTWAWQQTVSDFGAKLVLLKLADVANDEGVAWPGLDRLARECEMEERTVRRKITLLRDQQLIEVERRGVKKTNVYTLRVSGQSVQSLAASDRTNSRVIGHSCVRQTVSSEPSEDALSQEPERASMRAERKRRKDDPLWDALADSIYPVTNDGERGCLNRALKLVRQSLNGTPEESAVAEVVARATRARAKFPDGGPMALANHWTELAAPSGVRRTGWRWVRGSHSGTYVRDPNGTDKPPAEFLASVEAVA